MIIPVILKGTGSIQVNPSKYSVKMAPVGVHITGLKETRILFFLAVCYSYKQNRNELILTSIFLSRTD